MNGYAYSQSPDEPHPPHVARGTDATAAQTRPRTTILCTMDLPDGHTLAAGEGADGRLGIYLDGALFEPAGRWERADVQKCIRAYLALRWERQLGQPPVH
jgi:hypothetical protein